MHVKSELPVAGREDIFPSEIYLRDEPKSGKRKTALNNLVKDHKLKEKKDA